MMEQLMNDAVLHRIEAAIVMIAFAACLLCCLGAAAFFALRRSERWLKKHRAEALREAEAEDEAPECALICANVRPECGERDGVCADFYHPADDRRVRKTFDPRTGEVTSWRDVSRRPPEGETRSANPSPQSPDGDSSPSPSSRMGEGAILRGDAESVLAMTDGEVSSCRE